MKYIDKKLMICYNNNMEKLAETPENTYHDLDARRRTNLHTDEQLRSNLDAWIGAPEDENDQAQKDLIAYLESQRIAIDITGSLYEKAEGKKINLENAYSKISEGSETIDTILGPENFAIGRHKSVRPKAKGKPVTDV